MSKKSRRDQRLHLFELGNDRCPICLTYFDKTSVENGKEVTLEHVPPKGLGKNSIAMCLTCAMCNKTAGEGIDPAAISLNRQAKEGLDVTVLLSDTLPMKGKLTGEKLTIKGRNDVLPEIRPNFTGTIKGRIPDPTYASVSHLKSAYLSVFSLLGPYGYKYAESEALTKVREQIMYPHDKVIEKYAFGVDDQYLEGDAVFIDREKQHWAVKVDDSIILLPRNGHTSFYDETEAIHSNGQGEIRGLYWRPVKFGRVNRHKLSIDWNTYSKAHTGVENLFGKDCSIACDNGHTRQFVIVDHHVSSIVIFPEPKSDP